MTPLSRLQLPILVTPPSTETRGTYLLENISALLLGLKAFQTGLPTPKGPPTTALPSHFFQLCKQEATRQATSCLLNFLQVLPFAWNASYPPHSSGELLLILQGLA